MADWKHRESTHACWFNTSAQRPLSHRPSRMLSWSPGRGRTIRPRLSRVEIKHTFIPAHKVKSYFIASPDTEQEASCHVSVDTSWTHLKTCALFTGHNNILQVGTKKKTQELQD